MELHCASQYLQNEYVGNFEAGSVQHYFAGVTKVTCFI